MARFGVGSQGDHGKRVSGVYLYRLEDSIGARSCWHQLCNKELILGMLQDGGHFDLNFFVNRSPILESWLRQCRTNWARKIISKAQSGLLCLLFINAFRFCW